MKKPYLKLKVMNIFVDYILEVLEVDEDKVDDDMLYFAAAIAYDVFLNNTNK